MNYFQRLLFLVINSLFVAKYSIRIGLNPFITTLLYCLFSVIILWIVKKNTKINFKQLKTTYIGSIVFISIGIALLNYFINPLNLQVDRWSAIHNFIQNLFGGIYPYSAHTHLGGYGSPFPIWQVFHIPFYLLGNVGLGMLFSFILLAAFLVWFFEEYYKPLIFMILICISPAFWYEVAVRSDLIYNFMFCLITIGFLFRKKYSIQHQSVWLGVLCGLFLSTRFSIIIPFAIYLFPDFIKAGIKQKIIFSLVAILVFILTFLPLIFWNYNTLFFFKYNPFILQTRQGSMLEVIIIAILGLFLSLKWKENFSYCSSFISITLIILVAATFLHRMISDGFNAGLFDSAYDITYLNMALPFILFSISSPKQFKKKSL